MPTQKHCAYCGMPEPLGGLIDHHGYVGGSGWTWDTVCADATACSRRQERTAQLALMQAALAANTTKQETSP